MNPDRYQRVFEIFTGVCHLSPEERGPALDRVCLADTELRTEVEQFLKHLDDDAPDSEVPLASSTGARERPRVPPGTVLGNSYRIEELIGEGGMGTVYRATDLGAGGFVAVKLVSGDSHSEANALEREALAIARLAHPNIVTVRELGHEPELGPFIVMELLSGHTLDHEIASRGPLPLDRALEIVDQICDAVSSAHAAGVIHRDLKPQNVILEPTDEGPVVKVLDFGLARLLDPNTIERGLRSISGALVGTPHFMCPEQFEGESLDARSDVYSLGCVLYAMLTGRPPFEGDSLAVVILKHLDDEPLAPSTFAPSLPPELDEAVLRALAKAPDERFQSVADFRSALRVSAES